MTKLLLVEDDKSLREIYGVRLLAEGYDIVSAGDGEEALAMAIKEHPQLIVSDVMMPKISGFDMLDILRSTTETKDIKVIMMTALSSEDQRARGEALGADRYLVKSQVGIEDVVRTVHDVLGDAPIARPSASQTFGAPTVPTAAPRPMAPVAPRPTPPVYTTPQPAPTAAPQQITMPQPVATAPRSSPTPAPYLTPAAPISSPLPQPTAPFSTQRPANLGDRIIHPITPPAGTAKQDLGSLMEQELNNAPQTPTVAPIQPQVAQPQPIVTPPQPQQPIVQPPVNQFVMPPQQAPLSPQPATPQQPSGISFEETPRPTPPTNPFTPGPQPPIGQ